MKFKIVHLKIILIILLCSIIDFLAHGLTSAIAPFRVLNNPSVISKHIGFIGASFLWIIIAFSAVTLWYFICKKIPPICNSNKNALILGLSVGILWFIGMIESDVMSTSTSFISESIMGLCDASQIVLLTILLNKFSSNKITKNEDVKIPLSTKKIIISICIFTMTFVGIRYIFYLTELISSGYIIKPVPTFIWTMSMGIFIGILYILFNDVLKNSSIFLKGLYFTFVIFGIPWFSFLSFIPIVFQATFMDIILRCLCDGLSVFLGYFFSSHINKILR